MSEILYHRIQFTDANPYGDFIAGDTIDIYYDDTVVPPTYPTLGTDGIVVYKNGVEILSGADISTSTETYKSTQSYNPLVCYTTSSVSVIRTNPAFPYGYVTAFADHPSCATNGPVCDLSFVGTPVVTPASESVADGSIVVTASSSNSPIQYRLNEDFAYNDGTAQSNGTFTGLSAGQYRIYTRDSVNCSANILVTVPVNEAYAPVYRLDYDDPVGGVSRIDITQRGYGGSITEVKGANIGFERGLKGEASLNKFETILATKAVLHLTSETDFAYSGLYTNNPEQFRIEYSKLTEEGGSSSLNDLPALNTWLSASVSSDKADWTTGVAPSVTVPGQEFPNAKSSEILYADYAFVVDRTYNITLNYTRVTNSGSANPRTARLAITDSSDNEIFFQTKATNEGANAITISFTATALCDRLAFSYSSGMNVTITVNSISGTIDGFALWGLYKVLPQQYSEEYKAAPYYVSIVAIDGLAGLKDYVFLKDDGQRFHESMKSIELIAYILKKTGLELSIRCGINLYATGMDAADDDDPLDQAYVDCDTYYINEAEPTLNYVLWQILKPYGASIVQEFGVWNIVRVEEKRAAYDYREFDFNGQYVSNSSFDPILNVAPVGQEGFHFSDRDHHMTLCPGYGKIRLFYRLGLRENILENGDFRLTSSYDTVGNQYSLDLDTRGFQLVSPNYPISSTWEAADQITRQRFFAAPEISGDNSNVAWKIEGGSGTDGSAYIVSDICNIKMAVANTLKLSLRFKVPEPRATTLFSSVSLPISYQKVKLQVTYGDYYLLGDGSWSQDENFITIYVDKYGQYVEYDFTATQPDSGATSGYDFQVKLFHSYVFDLEFSSFSALRSKVTFDTVTNDPTIPYGTRSEVTDGGSVYYYELEQNSEDESSPNIIRPNDYDGVAPAQWILKKRFFTTQILTVRTQFWIDYIRVSFLTDGSQPTDAILREIQAEPNNTAVLEEEVVHGSYQSLVTTIPQWDFGLGKLSTTTNATLSLITTNILAAELLYAGYLRDSTGAGYTTWTRDGISEQSSLHLILLRQYAAQYKRSWRRLTGSFYSQSKYFNFLNVFRIVNDTNRLYLPISPTIDDVNNRVRGEFLELIDITQGAGSDGSGTAPFSSGFTSGFGKGYN